MSASLITWATNTLMTRQPDEEQRRAVPGQKATGWLSRLRH
ncbi:hypothetical protein [Streptomyces longispororuber]